MGRRRPRGHSWTASAREPSRPARASDRARRSDTNLRAWRVVRERARSRARDAARCEPRDDPLLTYSPAGLRSFCRLCGPAARARARHDARVCHRPHGARRGGSTEKRLERTVRDEDAHKSRAMPFRIPRSRRSRSGHRNWTPPLRMAWGAMLRFRGRRFRRGGSIHRAY